MHQVRSISYLPRHEQTHSRPLALYLIHHWVENLMRLFGWMMRGVLVRITYSSWIAMIKPLTPPARAETAPSFRQVRVVLDDRERGLIYWFCWLL